MDRHNNVDVSVYQGEVKQKSCGTLQLTYGLEQADQIYTLICNTEGDTVKLSKSMGHIAVFEVATISTGTVKIKVLLCLHFNQEKEAQEKEVWFLAANFLSLNKIDILK